MNRSLHRLFRFLAPGLAALMVLSCRASTQLPLKSETVELPMNTERLVCHVRNIASSQQLSFHYGTSVQPYGTLATFRLIGDSFEIVLYNPEKASTYILDLYDMSKGDARERAEKAYAIFAHSLSKEPSEDCVN